MSNTRRRLFQNPHTAIIVRENQMITQHIMGKLSCGWFSCSPHIQTVIEAGPTPEIHPQWMQICSSHENRAQENIFPYNEPIQAMVIHPTQ